MIDELLNRARQRFFIQSSTEIAAVALASGSAAFSLVMIAGTTLLAFWIPLAAGVVALGLASFREFRRNPTLLRVAQVLDRRCELHDALATELQFRGSSLEVARAQHRQTEAAARTIIFERALPFQQPRWLFPAVGLMALASFLFLLRFGVQRRLELSAPLAAVLQDPFSNVAARAEGKKRPAKPDNADVLNRLGTSSPEPDDPLEQKLPNQAGSAIDSGAPPATLASGKAQEGEKTETNSSEQSAAAAQKSGQDQQPSSREGAPQSAQGAGKSHASPESSGMLSKLRDAMSGLMSKMKPQGNQPPSGSQQKSQQASGKQPGSKQESGQKGAQDGQKSSDGEPQSGEDDAAASDSEQSKSGDGKGKTDQNSSTKPGSGMGHSDGSKDLKDAEQLAAMGKLSEIIGKRSANVTGEMTIESQSGPQQLRTAYARSDARHAATSGDISRDEVPIEVQAYVQKYFEQVRKQAAKKESR